MVVSYYNGVKDKEGVVTHIINILERIRLCHYSGAVESARTNPREKLSLPAACFSGRFSKRQDNSLQEYSGIVVLDIDERDYQKIMMVKPLLVDDPYVFCFFESPNRGLKVLFKVETGAELHRDVAFPQVKEYFEDNYGLGVDSSGKNISRLCFISADPDTFINEDCLPFSVDETYRPAEFYKNTAQPEFKDYAPTDNLSYIFDKCMEWNNKGSHFSKGNRNNYIFQLSCRLNRAGVSLNDAKALILNRLNPNMPYRELNTTITGVYQRNSNEHGSRPIYQKKSENSTLF